MPGKILDISKYENQLHDIHLTSDQISEQVSSYLYVSMGKKEPMVENCSLPVLVPSFYDFINTYGRIPTQDESFGYTLGRDKDEYLNCSISVSSYLFDIKARHARIYASILRDVHFGKYLSEHLPENYGVIFNEELDVKESIDVLVICPSGLLIGVCLCLDSNYSNHFLGKKVFRHEWPDNVEKVILQIKIDYDRFKNQIQLYDESHYLILLDQIHNLEAKHLERTYPLLCEEPEKEDQYTRYLPISTIKAACGTFIDGGIPEIGGWISVLGTGIKANTDRIVVRASGSSMLPKIMDGDYCVFEKYHGGSREGLIVLARTEEFDSDYSGRYTIKKYHSESVRGDGEYLERKIDLIPLNKDFETLHLSDDEQYATPLVFVGVIDLPQYHCIRCGKKITFHKGKDNSDCYCSECYEQWISEGHLYISSEKYCHECGQQLEGITYARPFCIDCYKKNILNSK